LESASFLIRDGNGTLTIAGEPICAERTVVTFLYLLRDQRAWNRQALDVEFHKDVYDRDAQLQRALQQPMRGRLESRLFITRGRLAGH